MSDEWHRVHEILNDLNALRESRDHYLSEQYPHQSHDDMDEPVDGWCAYDETMCDFRETISEAGEGLADAVVTALAVAVSCGDHRETKSN